MRTGEFGGTKHGRSLWYGFRALPHPHPTQAPRRRRYAGKKGTTPQAGKHDTFGAFSENFRCIFVL
jgi:hypothetical protein